MLYCLLFYAAYTAVRDIRGDRPVSKAQAFTNAKRIIGVEQFFGLFQERRIQQWFLHSHLIVQVLDDFYGSAHFVITLAVLIWLFRRQRDQYSLWRNTLAITTGLALIGFALFPLMPPRLLPTDYHFADTLRTVGGLWSFESGPITSVSNLYAAMPSLHFAWALWCALSVRSALHSRAGRAAVWLYPALTLLCIVVTANHYLADAAAGAVTLGVGYLGARLVTSGMALGRQAPV